MTLAEKLSTYDEGYWDFSEYRNDSPLVRYPAVMVAPMQACIFKEIIASDASTSTVLDPFCGSGMVLCERQELGLNVIGFDIRPCLKNKGCTKGQVYVNYAYGNKTI